MKRIFVTTLTLFLTILVLPIFASESKSMTRNSYTFSLGDEISLIVTAATFDPAKHQITKCKILDWSGVCLIDGKPVFGTDWELPKTQLIQATLKIANTSITLDVSCMYNPWVDKANPRDFTLKKVEGGYLIQGVFSDAAGSYEAEWFVIQNSSVRTRLVRGEC